VATIDDLKEQASPVTPLFLFDCMLSSGATERWSTHAVAFEGNSYTARMLRHNLFELRASADDGLDGSAKIAVTLSNADSHFSQIEREVGFKGAQLTVTFLFYDLVANVPATEGRVLFRGVANPAEEITESSLRVTFNNRLNLQRVILPEVQILRRCPWMFPSNAAQRAEANNGGGKGKYSPLFKCGYSPDQPGGAGNLNDGVPFTSCDYTRSSCSARGMFDRDGSNATRRFGGIEFVPPQIQVRSLGEKGSHLSSIQDNLALYNDPVPLVYGTAWYNPPIVFARNDGNLTRLEVLLGMGEIERVIKVLAGGIDIPEGQAGVDMTATGWYNVITTGTRNGAFDPNFADGAGNPLGDPYGSMAMMSVVVPNRISDGSSLPAIRVLMDGLKLEQFDTSGASMGESFTNNPAWVLLDVLRRSGWQTTEVDLASFASAAMYSAEAIEIADLNGNPVSAPRFGCNLVLQKRYSAGEIAKGIRLGSTLMLTYGSGGLLTLKVENTLGIQQATKPDGSNSAAPLNGGWPAYEFSDASAGFSGLLRNANGDPAIRLRAANTASTPNRLTVEFQDEFNEYQQDSLALVDVDDALLTDRQVTASFGALGIPNFDQAARVMQVQLNKSIEGCTLIDFETTVKGIGLAPGDLITITYQKEGLARQPFRVVRLAPGPNFRTVQVTAQWHDDAWYATGGAATSGTRRQAGAGGGLPRPLVGSILDANGVDQFGIAETTAESTDGSYSVQLAIAFVPPANPGSSAAAIPLVSLDAIVSGSGGTVAGGQALYYALSAVDGSGAETALSFVVAAKIPAGPNTNTVTLSGMSFSSLTTGFNVYRGSNPVSMLRIAANLAVAGTYIDTGAAAQLAGPPDENYDHANFYWRLEQQPEVAADVFSTATIGNNTLGMLANDFKGAVAHITRGTGCGQERAIISNDAHTLTIAPPWTTTPDSSSYFVISDATWKFGGLGTTSPVLIDVPNRGGTTVQISGRSANVQNRESVPELNPLTRWQIGGAAGGGGDADVPPAPLFGLSPGGHGSVDLVGISFPSLVNTQTISAGTLSLYSWNELASPTSFTLAAALTAVDSSVTLATPGAAAIGDFIQIESEVLRVTGIATGGGLYQVDRGTLGSTAIDHAADALIYHLKRDVTIVPFVDNFFGSPASGSYTASISLPDARIAAAELGMSNDRGAGPSGAVCLCGTADQGLRLLSGGQLSIQIEGYLAVQNDAAPPLVVDEAHAVRDISAVVREAPAGGAVELQLRQGTIVYCTLTIADGATTSNVVSGFGLKALDTGAQISLDILSVPGGSSDSPGRDLAVTVRL
jgi:hypothetical protein